jgi:hypothetical protein
LNKTEKLIVAFLLAFTALAGALHFLFPITHVPVVQTTQVATPATNSDAPREVVETPVTDDSAPDTLDKFREWAARDSGAALSWAAEQSDSEKRNEWLEAACDQIAQTDPARAVVLADNFGLTNGTLMNLEQQWAQKDLPAAREWALAKPASNQKGELLERVAYVWAFTEPEKAARFAVEKMQPGQIQVETVISVLHQWVLRDANGAAAWVQLFLEGDIRTRAMNELDGMKQYQSALSSASFPK